MKCETVSTELVCAIDGAGVGVPAVAHYTYEIVTTTDLVSGDETKRTRKTETVYTDGSGNVVLDPADFVTFSVGACPVAAVPVEPVVYALTEVGCLQDPASLDMTNVDRCEIGRVIIDGNELGVNLDAGWSIDQFVNAVNTAAPGTLANNGNNIVAASGKAIANIQIGCTTVVFQEDFGVGPGRTSVGASTPGATTTYGYVDGNPSDGQYTITTMGDPVMASWYDSEGSLTADGRGNVNGRAMFIGAAAAPGEFFRLPVTGLTSGTVYGVRFRAVNTTITPAVIRSNVKSRVFENGVLVGEQDTGTLQPDMPWETFLNVTYTATQSTAEFVLINNEGGGFGNDLAIDEIEFVSLEFNSYVMEPRGYIQSVEIVKLVDAENGNINSLRVFAPDGQTEFTMPFERGRVLSTGNCNIPRRLTD